MLHARSPGQSPAFMQGYSTGNGLAFAMQNGIARPDNDEEREAFKALQRTVNIARSLRFKPAITVDGFIGPDTADAVNDQLKFLGGKGDLTVQFIAKNPAKVRAMVAGEKPPKKGMGRGVKIAAAGVAIGAVVLLLVK